MASFVTLLDVDRVVLGGELAAAGEVLVGPLRYGARPAGVTTAGRSVDVVTAELGDRAEALGAVALVLREPRTLGAALLARR